jgi:hypothetical protein
MNNLYTCRMHAAIRCLDIYMSFITGTLMHGREICRVMVDSSRKQKLKKKWRRSSKLTCYITRPTDT